MSRTVRALLILGIVTGAASTARAEVDFVKDIQPLLEAKCVKCHGPERPKAGLSMHNRDVLVAGGKGGEVVVVGNAAESILIERINYPEDDELRMPPPEEGPPLSQAEKDLFSAWINEGMKWPEDVVLKIPDMPKAGVEETGLPITDEEKLALVKIQDTGALAMRLAQNTNWLRVDFSLQREAVPGETLALLKDMPNLMELDLGGLPITDEDLAHVAELTNLRRLQLQKTNITDAGLEHLKGLTKLESLNLYGTEVTDAGLEQLKELTNLKKLYLWQSKATKEGAAGLAEAIPELDVNLGYEEPAPAPEEKPEGGDQ